MYYFRVSVLFKHIFILWLVNAEEREPGLPIRMTNNRIYGGSNAPEGFAVHQVSLRRGSDTTRHFCGGSFISACHVLTAAHCQQACVDLSCKVAYGSNVMSRQTLVDVEAFKLHEDYTLLEDPNGGIISIQNDIAIVKLKRNSYPEFNHVTNYIELSQTKTLLWLTIPTTTGWGYIRVEDQTNIVPQDLQVTDLIVVPCSIFNSAWTKFICTSALKTGVCPGDSGGPLVHKNRLIGVTSFGSECGATISRNGFTDVYHYKSWIEKTMQDLPC